MPDGAPAYELRLEVVADFDGVLPAPEEVGDLEGRRAALLAALAAADADALLDEIYHREQHLLCPACRDRFLANPLNLPLPQRLP